MAAYPNYPNRATRSGNPAHRVGLGPKPPRQQPPRVVRPPRMTIDQWAQKQAQRYIDSQIAGIEEQRQIFLDELQKRSELEAQRGLALANALQGMNFGGRIQNIYGTAAGDIAGLAGGFSEGMRAQADAQAAEMANMVSGTGQEGATRNEGVGMADVNYGTQGFIPGRSLSETGAAFGMQAALEPSFAARIGQLEAGRVHSEGLKGLDQFTQALIEARSGKMDLVEKFKAMRQDAANDRFKQRMEILKWQSDEHYRRFMIYREQGRMDLANRELALAQRKQRQAEMEANRQYDLDVRREDRLGKDAKTGGKKVTVAQARDSMKDVVASEEQIREDITKAIKNGAWTPSAGKSPQKKKLIESLFKAYSYMALTPQARKRLRQIIIQAVNEAGRIGPPGPGSSSGSGSTSSGGYDDYR